MVAPDLIDDALHGACHSNNGDGLNKRDSLALAVRLRDEIRRGAVAVYAAERDHVHALLKDDLCNICGGIGKRSNAVADANPHLKQQCNGCEGTGTVRPVETHYPFNVENVERFAEFLEHCGGFRCC